MKADAAVGRHELTHVRGRPLCRLLAGWVIRPVGSILVVERKTDLRPWEQMVGQGLGSQGPGWRKDTQAPGRTRPSSGAFLPPGAWPGQGQARGLHGARVSGHVDGALCENAGTETSSPWRFREPGSTARCVVCAQRRDGRGRVSRPRHAASPGLLALEDASTAHARAFSGVGRDRRPRREEVAAGGPRGGALAGPGRQVARMARLQGRLPLGQRARGDDGEPRPSDGGLELFAHRELNVFVRSGCFSEPAPWAAWTARFTVYSLEDGRPGPGICQEVSLLGLGTAISSPCPHAAGRGGGFFLAVSFSV